MDNAKRFKGFLKSKMFTLLLMLAFLVLLFTLWAPLVGNQFLTGVNFFSILDSLVVTSFLAIGAGCLMVSGNLDLSASAVGAFGGVLIAVCIKSWALPWPLAILLTLAACAAIGALNGALVNVFNFQPFIATMAMAAVIKGLMYFVSLDPTTGNATTVNFSQAALTFIGSYKIFGTIPFTVVIMLAAFLLYGLMLNKTKFGMSIYLVGGNRSASRLTGISPKKISYILFANSAMLAGVSGIIMAARTRQGNLNALTANQFTGLTAAILGGISFGGGNGGMGGAFVGLLILNTFNKGTTVVKFDTYWTTVLSGLLLLVALTLDYFGLKRAQKIVRLK
ncbi:MAG: ABC transporter permease [Oscillospiraceae bacterium]|jgi:ribose/xylose/arabinose/galactoside ABC-type transport system permease subunit|nr:ABC transporter permease [Oscillospiraceae bacterium]